MRTLKKIKRRLWALILCFCMVLSCFTFVNTAYTMDDAYETNSAENGAEANESGTIAETEPASVEEASAETEPVSVVETSAETELANKEEAVDEAEMARETEQSTEAIPDGAGGGISESDSDSATPSDTEQGGGESPDKNSDSNEKEKLPGSSDDSDSDEIGSGGQTSAVRILSFIALKNEILTQEYPVGTSIEKLNLPNELEAVCSEGELAVPVKWISEPEFNGSAEGEYVFRPEIENRADYELAEGIELPTITVSVKANPAEDDTEANESETIRETELAGEAETTGETELTSEEETSGETELTSEAEILETKNSRYVLKRRKGSEADASGDLKVTKHVTGSLVDENGVWHFEVRLSDTTINGQYGDMEFYSGVAKFTLKDGEEIIATNLPEGITYTVVEQESNQNGYSTSIVEKGDGVDAPGDGIGRIIDASSSDLEDTTGDLAFTNHRDAGNLTVSKKLSGNAVDIDSEKKFTFTVDLNDTTINDTFSGVEFKEGKGEFQLKGGESKTIVLPAGLSYTVIEKEAGEDSYTTTYKGNTGTIPVSDTVEVEVTNTKNEYGNLSVKKTLLGNAVDPEKYFTFTVDLNDTTINDTFSGIEFKGGKGNFQLRGGESKTIEGLPAGLDYTVIEEEADEDGYTTTYKGETGEIPVGATVEAEFTNYKSEPHKEEKEPGKNKAVEVGDTITYRISYENVSENPMTILITDPLDVGLDFVFAPETPAVEGSYTAPAGVNDASARTVTWMLENVPAGTKGYVELTAQVNAKAVKPGTTTNQVANQASVQFGNNPAINTEMIENPVASGDLKVMKTVTGNAGEKDREWHFTVTLTQDSVTVPVNGTYGEMTFTNGIAEFTLKSGESKEAADLPAGISYTVTEAEAGQDGYTTTATGDMGMITSDRLIEAAFINNKTEEEHQSEKTPGKGSIRVVKKLSYNGKPVYVDKQTFYAALFEDPECTVMVSAVMPLNFVEASSAAAVFDGVEVGKTYYVAELDTEGNVIRGNGHLEGLIDFNVSFYNGNKAVVTENGGTANVEFANEFVVISERFHMTENMEITKILLDPDGGLCDSDRIFYAGIFDDPEFTQLSGQVNQNIVPLKLNGNSSVTAHVDVRACMEGEQIFLYVTEVDEDGQPVDDSIGCKVTVENGRPVFDEQHGRWDVTITNQMVEEETESEFAEEQPATDETEAISVKTGDDTPFMRYLCLLVSAAAILSGMLVFRRRKNHF